MKITLIATLFFLYINHVGAAMSDGMKNYYKNVNRAESALMDSNYASAIHFYRQAFKESAKPFVKDRYNLAICCAINNDYRKCYEQLKRVLDRGVSLYQLKQRETLAKFFKSGFGPKLIAWQRSHAPTYNIYYRTALDSLVRIDQEFRMKEGGYRLYGDTIRKIDSLNVIAFNKLIAQYGFPTEELVGVDTGLNLVRPIYHMLIIHQQNGAQNHFWDYTDLVSKAADIGDIEAHAAAEYIEKCSGHIDLGVMSAGLVQLVIDSAGNNRLSSFKKERSSQPFGYFQLAQAEEDAVNVRRDEMGLETLAQARRKTAFMQADQRFVLPSSTVSVLVCTSQAQYDKMFQSLTWMQ